MLRPTGMNAITVVLFAFSWNYPGGYALSKLHAIHQDVQHRGEGSTIHVHIDTAAAMTGVSRWGEDDGPR